MVETECKRGRDCRSPTCVFNHPGRKDCREGDCCRRKDCYYNHRSPICVFFPECEKADCQYRHPPDATTATAPDLEVINGHNRREADPHFGWIPRNPKPQSSSGSKNNEGKKGSTAAAAAAGQPKGPKNSHQKASTSTAADNATSSTIASGSSSKMRRNQSSEEETSVGESGNKGKKNNSSRGWGLNKKEGVGEKYDKRNECERGRNNYSEGGGRSGESSNRNRPKDKETKVEKQSANATATSSKPSNKQKNQKDEEIHLLKNHRNQMSLVREKLISLLSDEDLQEDIRSTKTSETIDTLRKQLDEFDKQEKMYKMAVKRAKQTLKGEELELQLKREAFRLKNRLPSLAERKNIEDRLEDESSRFIVIQGQTGSGKSSQIAQYVADHPRFKGKRVVVTQPRKIAAISLANRVSEEYSGGQNRSPYSRVGKFVGYHVGGQKRTSPTTRIEFVTEGVMLEKIMTGTKEAFNGIGCIVVDEAHERSIMCDILLGSFKNSKDPRWKDILIIVTSATIDLDFFSKFFNNTRPLEIPGRAFPVDITYCPISHDANIVTAVVECAFKIHVECELAPGDILCFLPGQDDVVQARATFERKSQTFGTRNILNCVVFALYGRLEPSEQAKIFLKQPNGIRKVIFATDVAETSLTIDGVVYVVDSGVKKEMLYDPKRNISSLTVNTISKSSAIQRAGRSGRTQPGHTYRLYSRDEYECMDTSTTPEIFRKPLGLAILSLRDMNIDPNTFQWISVPPPEAIKKAEKELRVLGAIDESGRPTGLGSLISISQQEPKLVRMIYKACERGFGNAAITCASLLSVANIFFRGGKGDEVALQKRKELGCPEGDVITMYELFQNWENLIEGRGVNFIEMMNGKQEANIGNDDHGNKAGDKSTVWDFLQVAEKKDSLTLVSGNNQNDGNEDDEDEELQSDDDEIESEDDDEDTRSVSQLSEKSSILSVASKVVATNIIRLTRRQREKCFKLAADFVRSNCLNKKALGLVKDSRSELLAIFRRTKIWKSQQTQNKVPTKEDLQRIIFGGYFLNVARQVHSKPYGRRSSVHYFGLTSEVYGSLDYKSSIVTANKKNLPEWITFDRVLRLGDASSVTLLTTATSMPEYMAWLEEESPLFAEFCRNTCESLPTEHIVLSVPSEECLRFIFGRFFTNIKAIEDDMDCAMEVNQRTCLINVFTSLNQKPVVELYLKRVISDAVTALRHQFIEEEYMGSTRVVLGQGYEVQDVLFPQEFITAFLRKLSRSISDKDKLMRFVENAIPTSVIHSVDIRYHETSNFGIVNFKSKEMARRYFPDLLKLSDNNSEFSRKVGGITKEKKFRSGEVARLKISWPLSTATGKVYVTFRTASQANSAIRTIESIFPGTRVTNAEGTRLGIQSKRHNYENAPKKELPMVEVSKVGRIFTFKYIDDAHQPRQGLDYKITLVNVPTNLDEFEISARLNRFNPKQVKVERDKSILSQEGNHVDWRGEVESIETYGIKDRQQDLLAALEASVQALEGIQRFRNALTTQNDFMEQHLMRGGVYVYLDDVKTTEEAHKELALMEVPFPLVFRQPVRVEIEYTKTVSVQWDLYEFLEGEINRVLEKARSDGVVISRPNKNKKDSPNQNQAIQRFATVKLRHKNLILVEKYQKILLDEVMVCKKISQSAEHSLFFSFVGRSLLEALGKTRFLHWDIRTQFIWVYGPNERTRKDTITELEEVLRRLKALEVLDKEILLDKKKVDFRRDKMKIEDVAKKAKVTHVQFSGRNRLLVSGSKNSVAEFEKILGKWGHLFVRRVRRNDGQVPECGLCFCECNEENIRLSECGHIFCLECIFPMLNGPTPQVPIACPSCSKSLVIADITKITNNKGAVLRKFVEAATLEYASRKKDSIGICPQPGCNQMLDIANFRTGPAGGRFVSCDECVSSYCIDCSRIMEKPVMSHERDSCEEVQRDFGDDVMRHVREIQNNIFNLQCPRCKTAFLEFVGCAAVTCGTCSAAFCGICLEDCGKDAHPHVRTCNLNPKKNEFFIDKPNLDRIHRKKRTDDLVVYLKKIQPIEERTKVVQALRRDLQDLDVQVPASFFMTTTSSTRHLVFSKVSPENLPEASGGGLHLRDQVEIDRILALQLDQEEREAARAQQRAELQRQQHLEIQRRADEQRIREQNLLLLNRFHEQDARRNRERNNRCIIS